MEQFLDMVGVIPAIVFPGAALVQLLAMLKRKHSAGVSVLSWWMFAVANLCLYIYTQKYFELIAILTFLGSASLNSAVALTAMHFKRLEKAVVKSD